LVDWFGPPGEHRARPEARAGPEVEAVPAFNRPLGFQLTRVRYHEYLARRGITEETARKFGVGFFPGKSIWLANHRIVIPIHNPRRELVAYAGRTLRGAEPKYLVPKGFRKSLELFNLHRVKGEEVILVEGFFSVMWLHQLGYPAVGLMGSSLSEAQRKLLERFQRVVIMLDGDEAGRAAARKIAAMLITSRFVRVVKLLDGTQPDTLSAEEVQKILE
jgi:DNA primase